MIALSSREREHPHLANVLVRRELRRLGPALLVLCTLVLAAYSARTADALAASAVTDPLLGSLQDLGVLQFARPLAAALFVIAPLFALGRFGEDARSGWLQPYFAAGASPTAYVLWCLTCAASLASICYLAGTLLYFSVRSGAPPNLHDRLLDTLTVLLSLVAALGYAGLLFNLTRNVNRAALLGMVLIAGVYGSGAWYTVRDTAVPGAIRLLARALPPVHTQAGDIWLRLSIYAAAVIALLLLSSNRRSGWSR